MLSSMSRLSAATARRAALSREDLLKGLVAILLFIVAATLLLEIELPATDLQTLSVGDVAPEDIVAPNAIEFEDTVATELARDRAEGLVSELYSAPDPDVARQQRQLATQVLTFLDAVRADPYATSAQKIAWIQEIEPVTLDAQEAAAILNLRDGLWQDVRRETLSVLDRAMSTEVRESQLSQVTRRLPVLISPSAPAAESQVVLIISEELIRPNTFVDDARTNEARQQARESVEPVMRSYEANQIIVRAGEIISREDIEALQFLGLQNSGIWWREMATTAIWLTVLMSLLGYYLVRYHIEVLQSNERLILLMGMMILFVGAIRAMVPSMTYAIPMAGLTIVIAALLDPRLAIVTSMIMAFIEVYYAAGAAGSLELFAYVALTSLVVALAVGRQVQLQNLLFGGLYATLSNLAIVFIFQLLSTQTDLSGLGTKVGGALLSGVLSVGLALVALLIIGKVTNMTTYIQLLELSRPTHPLLAELLRRAPGTYHHSLLVSNLAEHAAERIGADAFLCRIGAYYHDVGKMLRPYFFTENTVSGMKSLHDGLDPLTSAQILTSHVTDGLELARKHRLPKILRSFIAEHHGTEVPGYFYHQALEAVGGDESKLDRKAFMYVGPKPQSRETAIMMLADASEATVRSVQPQSLDDIDRIVRATISRRLESGQLDECDLTMRDLEQIRIAFNEVLKGVSHPRVRYPDQVKEEDKLDTGPLPPLPLAMQGANFSLEQGDVSDELAQPVQKE